MNKTFVALLSVVLAAGMLAGCRSPSESESPKKPPLRTMPRIK